MHFSTIEIGVKLRIGSIEMEILYPLNVIERDVQSANV